jgi:hypothetical protein
MRTSFWFGLVFIFVATAVAEKPREPVRPIAAGNNGYETKVFPISGCVRHMVEAGKAQTPQKAEEKILAILKKVLPLLPGESLVLAPGRGLVATLQLHRDGALWRLIYPKIEVTFYHCFLPRSVEPRLKTLSLPAPRFTTKPVEWKLSEKQFAAFLKEIEPFIGRVEKQSRLMNVGNEDDRFRCATDMTARFPRNIPPKQYYTVIHGIDMDCVCRVDLAPNEKEYLLSYALRCLRKGFLCCADRTTQLRDMTRCYGEISFPMDAVLVQRFGLTDNPFSSEVEFPKKEDAGEPSDTFQDPDRDPLLFMAFQVKRVGKPQILQFN